MAEFVGANPVGALVNYGLADAGAFRAAALSNKYVAQACGVLAGLVFNFTLSKKLVFKRR